MKVQSEINNHFVERTETRKINKVNSKDRTLKTTIPESIVFVAGLAAGDEIEYKFHKQTKSSDKCIITISKKETKTDLEKQLNELAEYAFETYPDISERTKYLVKQDILKSLENEEYIMRRLRELQNR